MHGKVITVAQQKGGAGKTTLAAQLAVAFAAKHLWVALVDIDPQASLTRWFQMRDKTDNSFTLTTVTGWRTQAAVEKLKTSNDLVLIDSAPHAETDAKIAIRAADLVLVPVQPSPMDLWASEPTLALIRSEKREARLIVNRVQTRMKLAEEMTAKIGELGVAVLGTTIGNRTSFAGSMLDGRGVLESAPRSKAAEEMSDLADEIMALLAIAQPKRP
jgi:chromosome partitioning protein